jgi:ATP/maltotriose-dependent transcriptional regulator MalT
VSSDIVARDAELASIRAFLDRISAGSAALVIEGQSGIGKTTLWQAGVQEARARGFRLLSSRPTESEASLSFSALGDLVEESLPDVLELLPVPQRRALEVALLLAEAGRRPPDRRTVGVAVLGVLRALSRTGPVIVAADDIQWLDPSSAGALEFAVRRLTAEPVGLLLSVRHEDEGPLPLGLEHPPALEHTIRLPVGPVSRGELDGVLRLRLGRSFSRSILGRLHDASGGNPFFGLEVARALLRRGIEPAAGEPLPVPDTLKELIRERVARLPGRTRDVLLTVSAMGHPSVPQAERMHGARTARTALTQAIEAGLVELQGEDLWFTHPLLRSVVYADASPIQRRQIHARLASVSADPEERAQHLARAAEGPDAAVAEALDGAAREALARGAPEAAAELFEMARSLTPPEQAEEAGRRLADAGMAHFAAGDAPTSRSLLEEAVRLAPPGRHRAEALYQIGMVEATETGWPVAVASFERGLPEAVDAPDLRRSLEQGLGYASLFMGNLKRSEEHASAALEIAEELNDPVALAESLSALAFVRFVLGSGLPNPLIERAIELSPSADLTSLMVVLRPPFVYAQMLKYADRLDEASSAFRTLLAEAADEGQESALPVLHYHLAELECRAGDWLAAAHHAEESLRLAVLTGMPFYQTMAHYAVALVEAHRGRADSARRHAQTGLALAETGRVTLSAILNLGVLGFLELSLVNPGPARDRLERATELISSMGVVEPGYFRVVPDAVESLVAVGDLTGAEALLEPFEENAKALTRVWALAAAGRCRGLIAAAGGDLGRAVKALQRALREHDRLGQPFERGRTLLILGQVLRRDRKKRAPRETLDQARRIFEDLGAHLWLARTEAELTRVGGRAPTPLALTPTEERVAELVAAGRTNREIADALFMSVHTVEWNLSKRSSGSAPGPSSPPASPAAARVPSLARPLEVQGSPGLHGAACTLP